MQQARVLSEAEIRTFVTLDSEAVGTIEAAFTALATQPIVMPPIMRLDIREHRGEVDVKSAYIPGLSGFAIKISPGFFDNPLIGLPSVNGLMILLSTKTGLVEAIFLDNGYLTDVRTAAAGAVAARHLSREDSATAAIFGAGVQALLQLEALTLVRKLTSAVIWARDPDKARAAARLAQERLGIPVRAESDARTACAGADIIVTTTPAETPVLMADWVQPGQHVTAMGSDAEHKNELEPALIAKGIYVADRLSQTRVLGELHHAIRAGVVPADQDFPELGAITAGLAPGRRSPGDITICDLTGTGIQDTAIASFAFQRWQDRQPPASGTSL